VRATVSVGECHRYPRAKAITGHTNYFQHSETMYEVDFLFGVLVVSYIYLHSGIKYKVDWPFWAVK
jgi:hypothetical protein